MAVSLQIQCIRKSDRSNAHERITHVGGVNANGARWQLTETDAIAAIEQGTRSFYVLNHLKQPVAVIVTKSRYSNKYLRTVADGEQPDNLLNLPECP